jgi:hypothetical protein
MCPRGRRAARDFLGALGTALRVLRLARGLARDSRPTPPGAALPRFGGTQTAAAHGQALGSGAGARIIPRSTPPIPRRSTELGQPAGPRAADLERRLKPSGQLSTARGPQAFERCLVCSWLVAGETRTNQAVNDLDQLKCPRIRQPQNRFAGWMPDGARANGKTKAPEVLLFRGLTLVAGAGFAECYTQPDTFWIDLVR